MNGHFPFSGRVPEPPGRLRERHRLRAALLASGALHLGLLTAGYLGESRHESLPATAAEQTGGHRFSASLRAAPSPAPPARTDAAASDPAEGAGLLPFSAPHYYPTDQLTRRPQPLGTADLEAPEVRLIVASGKIVLRLWIDEFGGVNNVEIEQTDLPEVFNRSALAAFRRLRFTPGERAGVRVGSVMRIEVSYEDVRPSP